jgi:hypothetical protein
MVNELLMVGGRVASGLQAELPNHLKGRALNLENPAQSCRVILIATTIQ